MQIEMYKPDKLNLTEFINHYNLDMILNNELIRNDSFYFEFYNREDLEADDLENVTAEVKDDLFNYSKYSYTLDEIYENYYDQELTIEELLSMEPDDALEELEGAIEEYAQDYFYEWNGEIYQYFIIPENDLYLWSKYTSYPILYDDETDIYLLGITHWGMSWSFFFTGAPRQEHMKIKKYDDIILNKTAGAGANEI